MSTSKGFKKYSPLWLTTTALFMAMNVALSSFGVPVPGGHFYLNDIVICTAAILLDPVGAFIVSLVTHGLQAVVISLCVRRIKTKKPAVAAIIGVAIGAVIMVVGYSLGRAFIYSTPEYALLKLPYQILQAAIGAVVGVILCYNAKLKDIFEKKIVKK
jgi:uncharacterized membrane protein